jgi:MOSC domain-containing protein YiiM
MKLISLNCGMPRRVLWRGQSVTTSIYKDPVVGRIALRALNLDGDRQSDLTVHGGKDKAVYCYPTEHYLYWQSELPGNAGQSLPYGAFGENVSIAGLVQEGLAEESIHVGDRFSVGSAEVAVTQPRLPCFKLIIKFGLDDMVKRFHDSRRSGFYVKVTREGDVGAGDEVALLEHGPNSVSIAEINRLYFAKEYDSRDVCLVRRAIGTEALPDGWKSYFQEKLDRFGA